MNSRHSRTSYPRGLAYQAAPPRATAPAATAAMPASRPALEPDEGTFILSPHKGLSGFWAADITIQFRQRHIETIILAGMSANLCVESHLRDAVENGFEVLVVKDATVGPGPEATQAAYVNYGFIANEVVMTDEITERLRESAAVPAPPE